MESIEIGPSSSVVRLEPEPHLRGLSQLEGSTYDINITFLTFVLFPSISSAVRAFAESVRSGHCWAANSLVVINVRPKLGGDPSKANTAPTLRADLFYPDRDVQRLDRRGIIFDQEHKG